MSVERDHRLPVRGTFLTAPIVRRDHVTAVPYRSRNSASRVKVGRRRADG